LQVGAAGKKDDPYPVIAEPVDQPLHKLLGPVKPGRLQVARQHTPAHVKYDHDIHPLALHLFHLPGILQVGESQPGKYNCPQDEVKLPAEFPGRITIYKLADQRLVADIPHGFALPSDHTQVEQHHYREYSQGNKVEGVFKSQQTRRFQL
jgi:hypothetical protein